MTGRLSGPHPDPRTAARKNACQVVAASAILTKPPKFTLVQQASEVKQRKSRGS
jgi:hypothetical protein